jgi:hypothetical protein
MIDDLTVLVLPRNHFLGSTYSGGVRWTLGQAKALCEAGCNVYIVLPKKEDCSYKYTEEDLPNWDSRFIPVYTTTIKDHRSGVEVYTPDLLRLIVTRQSKYPYDIVLNHNTSMAIGMHKPLTETGFSQTKIPVFSVINNAASYKEFSKHPIGERDWYRYWEILEALSCYADGATIANKYDYNLMVRQIKALLAPSVALKALNNFHFIWGPIYPIVKPKKHKWDKSHGKFLVLLTGGFGKGREEYQNQAEAAVNGVKVAYAQGANVHLVVCTNSPKSQWTEELLKGTEKYVKVYRNPDPKTYRKIFDACHMGINVRDVNDAISLSLLELMISGKPIIWYDHKYMRPWIEPPDFMPCKVKSLDPGEVGSSILFCRENYETISKKAYDFAEIIQKRHDPLKWGETMKGILSDKVSEADEKFNKSKFTNYEEAFTTKVDPMSFDDAYKKLNIIANKSFSLYSRAWVLKMLRRYNKRIYVKDRKLWVSG